MIVMDDSIIVGWVINGDAYHVQVDSNKTSKRKWRQCYWRSVGLFALGSLFAGGWC